MGGEHKHPDRAGKGEAGLAGQLLHTRWTHGLIQTQSLVPIFLESALVCGFISAQICILWVGDG